MNFMDYLNPRPQTPKGYQQVFYDPKTGQYMAPNPAYNMFGVGRTQPQYIPINGAGKSANTPPAIDFNSLPNNQG
jgi:hypothetical protein